MLNHFKVWSYQGKKNGKEERKTDLALANNEQVENICPKISNSTSRRKEVCKNEEVEQI